jgi:hypothetical protein
MAQASKKRTTRAKKATAPAPAQDEAKQAPALEIAGMKADDFVAMQNRRIGESKSHWDGKGYKLTKTSEENERLYYGQQISDKDEDEDNDNLDLDNRIFSSIRTIIPYVTTRITEPEVYPSSSKKSAKRFAQDMEKALYIHARNQKLKKKIKFALEDAIVRRRGYIKPRYDAASNSFCMYEYVPAESIIIDHKAKSYEEPRYFRHILDKTPEDLMVMFPEMESRILEVFKIQDKTDLVKMQESHKINEDWAFVSVSKENESGVKYTELDLVVSWGYKETAFGAIQDPNWRYDDNNFIDSHMMPLVFFNVLNDGRGFIDKTSFVEQAKFSQRKIDARGKQIGANASLGSVGMPVVDSAALADDQSQYLTYEEDTVLELDVTNAGKQSINDVFTTWKASPLSQDVYKDKVDAIEAVQNAFGASAIMQGQQTNNNTLGQDELLRDQSMGRQSEIVDAIDEAMNRLYLLTAQMLLVYGDEEVLFKFTGENSEFDYVIMTSNELDTNAEIHVKNGTSMPIDNPQRRATADKASGQAMIDPLTYWEIMDEPNAQKIAKRVMDYKANPVAFLKDVDEELFNREAFVDIEILKQGGQPPFRDDLTKDYFDYLNQYVLSGNLESPKIPMETRQMISQFIDAQLARAQKMLGMAETQLPTPQDVAAHNEQVDAANQAGGGDNGGDPAAQAAAQITNQ